MLDSLIIQRKKLFLEKPNYICQFLRMFRICERSKSLMYFSWGKILPKIIAFSMFTIKTCKFYFLNLYSTFFPMVIVTLPYFCKLRNVCRSASCGNKCSKKEVHILILFHMLAHFHHGYEWAYIDCCVGIFNWIENVSCES